MEDIFWVFWIFHFFWTDHLGAQDAPHTSGPSRLRYHWPKFFLLLVGLLVSPSIIQCYHLHGCWGNSTNAQWGDAAALQVSTLQTAKQGGLDRRQRKGANMILLSIYLLMWYIPDVHLVYDLLKQINVWLKYHRIFPWDRPLVHFMVAEHHRSSGLCKRDSVPARRGTCWEHLGERRPKHDRSSREYLQERRGAGGVQPSERRPGNLFVKHTIENPGEGYFIQT